MAPADEAEMHAAMKLAISCGQPIAIRYPRDRVPAALASVTAPFEIGKSVRLRSGEDATILAYGAEAAYAMNAARLLAQRGVEVNVYNARFAQPLDDEMLREALLRQAGGDGRGSQCRGRVRSAVLERASELRLPVDGKAFRRLGISAEPLRATRLAKLADEADGHRRRRHRPGGAAGARPRHGHQAAQRHGRPAGDVRRAIHHQGQ